MKVLDLRKKKSNLVEYVGGALVITFAFLFFAIALPMFLSPMTCTSAPHQAKIICK